MFVVIMKQLNKLGKLLVILPQTKANDERTVPCGNVACGEFIRKYWINCRAQCKRKLIIRSVAAAKMFALLVGPDKKYKSVLSIRSI